MTGSATMSTSETDLVEEWGKLRLTEEESAVIGGDFECNDEEVKVQIALTMVGRLNTIKPYNMDAMKRTLVNVWRTKEQVAIRMVEMNLFVFQFFCMEDKERDMEGSPWFFDKKVLLLKEVLGDEQPSKVVFSTSPFWIRIKDVPFNRRNTEVAYGIGETMGGFLEYDDADPLGWEEFMRVKVLVEIDKPLRRVVKIATGHNSSKWCGLQYERLEDFCFYCGRLDHVDRDCQAPVPSGESKAVVYEYGPWLGSSPKRRAKLSYYERERAKQCLAKMQYSRTQRLPGYNDPLAVRRGPPGPARKLCFQTPPPAVEAGKDVRSIHPPPGFEHVVRLAE